MNESPPLFLSHSNTSAAPSTAATTSASHHSPSPPPAHTQKLSKCFWTPAPIPPFRTLRATFPSIRGTSIRTDRFTIASRPSPRSVSQLPLPLASSWGPYPPAQRTDQLHTLQVLHSYRLCNRRASRRCAGGHPLLAPSTATPRKFRPWRRAHWELFFVQGPQPAPPCRERFHSRGPSAALATFLSRVRSCDRRPGRSPVVLFIDEAHDIHGHTLNGLKRLMELITAGGESCRLCLWGTLARKTICGAPRWKRSGIARRNSTSWPSGASTGSSCSGCSRHVSRTASTRTVSSRPRLRTFSSSGCPRRFRSRSREGLPRDRGQHPLGRLRQSRRQARADRVYAQGPGRTVRCASRRSGASSRPPLSRSGS